MFLRLLYALKTISRDLNAIVVVLIVFTSLLVSLEQGCGSSGCHPKTMDLIYTADTVYLCIQNNKHSLVVYWL